MHPKQVFAGFLVVDDFWPLDDAVGARVSGCGARKYSALISPFYKVARRVAVDVLERTAICFVFTNPWKMLVVAQTMHYAEPSSVPIPLSAIFYYTPTMSLDMLADVCLDTT